MSPSPSPSPAPPGCITATRRGLNAETAALRAQQALSARLTALGKAISHAAGGASGGGGGSASNAGGSGPGGPVSAAQLAADQAAADAAAAQVTAAKQDLAAATVVAPISGTVVAVNVTRSGSATAGSTAFVVCGPHRYQVVVNVPVTGMPELKIGQRASVLPDGRSTPLHGLVASIGLAPIPGESPAAYPVVISLTGKPSGLHAGGYANVTMITAESNGVSVPTSAVHHSGRFTTVTVYTRGTTHLTRVTVGTMGPVMTRITSGLKADQHVVLTTPGKPIPTNNLTNRFPGPPGGPVFGGGQSRFVVPP